MTKFCVMMKHFCLPELVFIFIFLRFEGEVEMSSICLVA